MFLLYRYYFIRNGLVVALTKWLQTPAVKVSFQLISISKCKGSSWDSKRFFFFSSLTESFAFVICFQAKKSRKTCFQSLWQKAFSYGSPLMSKIVKQSMVCHLTDSVLCMPSKIIQVWSKWLVTARFMIRSKGYTGMIRLVTQLAEDFLTKLLHRSSS